MKKRPKKIRRGWGLREVLFTLAFLSTIIISHTAARAKNINYQSGHEGIAKVKDQNTTLLPIPIRSISSGESLSEIPITMTKWPTTDQISTYVNNIQLHLNKVVVVDLPSGLPIPINVLRDNTNLFRNPKIPSGMRAINLNVSSESALNGFVNSGDFVDVILIKKSKNEFSLESEVIASNIKLLSIDKLVTNRSNQINTFSCTLLVTQGDALKIKTANKLGEITFMLRGQNDYEPIDTESYRHNKVKLDEDNDLGSKKGVFKNSNGDVYFLTNNGTWLREISNQTLREEQIKKITKKNGQGKK